MRVQVFPQLYLPVMAEANLRSIRPWRPYIPTPSFFMFHWRVRQLNSYIRQLLRQRWNDRTHRAGTAKLDILDRLLNAIEVCFTDMPANSAALAHANACKAPIFLVILDFASRWQNYVRYEGTVCADLHFLTCRQRATHGALPWRHSCATK